MTRGTIALLTLALSAPLAHAEDWQDRIHWADRAMGYPPNQHVRPFRDEPVAHKRPQVRGYVRRTSAPAPKPEHLRQHLIDTACKPAIRVVGDQRPTEQGAREQADKAWMQEVRFRHGERFMDGAANARDVRYACTRSSVGEIAGVTQHRCEIIAIPCPAPLLWNRK